jgi:phosphatidate cytidylyltransferase
VKIASEFYKRSITGTCIVVVTSVAVYFGHYTFFLLCVAIGFLGLLEFYRLFGVLRPRHRIIPAFMLAFSLFGSVWSVMNSSFGVEMFLINVPIVSFILVTSLYIKSENPFNDIAVIFLGQIYVTLGVILFYTCSFVVDAAYEPQIIWGFFLFLWTHDTGAYIFGNLFGEHRLAPAISPKKTWEGSLGGAFLVIIMAYINSLLFKDLSLMQWMGFGAVVVVMGTLGDLIKSVMKRSFNVKDFGGILPGHGGVLDRFDSLIGSAPLVYAYLKLIL